jgi:hypothetical protein
MRCTGRFETNNKVDAGALARGFACSNKDKKRERGRARVDQNADS